MRITCIGNKIKLDQSDYLKKVLERFGMTNAKATSIPILKGYTPEPADKSANPKLRQCFQSVIGSLLYLMIGTRPDIAYAVIKLSQFSANPTESHLRHALNICHYLVGTQDYSLVYNGDSNQGLIAYTDLDWASDPLHCRSQTGFFLKLADCIISWSSHAQKTITLSSTEAEYMAMSDCC